MDKKLYTWKDYGYIDILSTRSSYSEGKKIAECLCKSYSEEYNIPVSIVRLSQTFGPGVDYNDGRVFAEFARCAIEKKDIVLHTNGNTLRSYCYTKDALTGIILVLLEGKIGEAYNVSNPETALTIKEMAQLVAKEFANNEIEVKLELDNDYSKFGYNPEMKIVLDITKIQELGWNYTVGVKEMFSNLIESMKKVK